MFKDPTRCLIARGMLALSPLVVAPLAWADAGREPRVVDAFESAKDWNTFAATGVGLTVSTEPGRDGNAMRVDYDFTAGSGFVILQRDVGIELPDLSTGATYEFTFDIRGEGPANDLEFKFLDTRGDASADASRSDVWWHNRRHFAAPGEWTTMSTRTRHVTFAWGISGGKPTRRVDKIEFAIAAAEGGKGTLWFDNLRYREVAPAPARPPTPVATASKEDEAHPASFAVDGDVTTAWRASGDSENEHASAWIDIDLGFDAEFGAVEIVQTAASRGAFTLDGTSAATGEDTWRPLARADRTGRARVVLWTPDSTARRLRIRAQAPTISIAEIKLIPPEQVATRNALVSYLAGTWDTADAPSPWPEMFMGVARDWTIVGVPESSHEALLSEQGIVETDKGCFSLEGLVRLDRNGATPTSPLHRLADGEHVQRLEDGWMPIPSVDATAGPIKATVTALATGDAAASTLLVRYRLSNPSDAPVSGIFFLAARPFQVNPPWQDLKATGGVAPTRTVTAIDDGLTMDSTRVLMSPSPEAGAMATLAMGEIVSALRGDGSLELINAAARRGTDSLEDPDQMASGAMSSRFTIQAGEFIDFIATVPFGADRRDVRAATPSDFAAALGAERNRWSKEVARVRIDLPGDAVDNAVRSTLSYILVNADGPGIQPGSRCYERSWIRDGSLTSAALLEYGLSERAVRFIDWYSGYVYPDGKVPCVVDQRGPDPVDEHDSHGQYIFAVMNAYRFTKDRAILDRHWATVARVVDHIGILRATHKTEDFKAGAPPRQEPGRKAVPAEAFWGIMPASISHEGYSAKPMHSFWDAFFTLRGLSDAAEIALARDDRPSAERIAAEARDFREAHMNAMTLSMRTHNVAYVPGCVELGDFDATSTTVAIWPGEQTQPDMREALDATFDQAMVNFRARRDGTQAWDGFTPYEWRQVGALVRLGRRADAREYFDWLFELRRPHAWNSWPEVVWSNPRKPQFFGDLPHTWCGSDFLNSVRAMLLFERDSSVVMFAGLGEDEAREGARFENMPTYFGKVDASLEARTVDGKERIVVTVAGDAKPPAGMVVTSPFDEDGRPSANCKAWIDGKPTSVAKDGTIRVFKSAFTVEFEAGN
jgi:hypothetical protein